MMIREKPARKRTGFDKRKGLLMGRKILHAFSIKKLHLNIDTDDFTLNAFSYPVGFIKTNQLIDRGSWVVLLLVSAWLFSIFYEYLSQFTRISSGGTNSQYSWYFILKRLPIYVLIWAIYDFVTYCNKGFHCCRKSAIGHISGSVHYWQIIVQEFIISISI